MHLDKMMNRRWIISRCKTSESKEMDFKIRIRSWIDMLMIWPFKWKSGSTNSSLEISPRAVMKEESEVVVGSAHKIGTRARVCHLMLKWGSVERSSWRRLNHLSRRYTWRASRYSSIRRSCHRRGGCSCSQRRSLHPRKKLKIGWESIKNANGKKTRGDPRSGTTTIWGLSWLEI